MVKVGIGPATDGGSHLEKHCGGIAIEQAKVALVESMLRRFEGVQRQHSHHAGEEYLPSQRLAEAVGQLLKGEQQATNRRAERCCYAHRRACTSSTSEHAVSYLLR